MKNLFFHFILLFSILLNNTNQKTSNNTTIVCINKKKFIKLFIQTAYLIEPFARTGSIFHSITFI